MKLATVLPTLGAVGLLTACRAEPTSMGSQYAIICEATVEDSAGVTVASIEDTVMVDAPRDTVGADPRPCRSSYSLATQSLRLNAKADTVGGSPVD